MSKRPLKILQFTTNFKQGGIQRHILDLTEFLRAQGHHVTLAGAPNVWGNAASDPDFVEIGLDQVSATDKTVLSRVGAAYQCAKILRPVLAERKIDLVHSHETAPAIVARLALRKSPIPTVITYHGSAPDRTKQFARISRYCAEQVVSPSRTTLGQLIDYGVPQDRATVLGLGVGSKPSPSPQNVEALRASLGLSENDTVFLSLSRLDFQKGIDHMIEVARKVLAKEPNAMFIVCGTGPMADEVKDWPKEAGIADRFKFMGAVSNVQEYLAMADVFLLTSRWEALPISIVEAFRAGLPVIATDCGGVAELVDSAVGRLCPVADTQSLASACLELATDAGLRQDLAAAALEKSKDARFDPASVHSAFEDFYLKLVGA